MRSGRCARCSSSASPLACRVVGPDLRRLGPFIGLQIRGGFGDAAMWGFFAAVSVLAAVLGVVACRYAFDIRKARLAAA